MRAIDTRLRVRAGLPIRSDKDADDGLASAVFVGNKGPLANDRLALIGKTLEFS